MRPPLITLGEVTLPLGSTTLEVSGSRVEADSTDVHSLLLTVFELDDGGNRAHVFHHNPSRDGKENIMFQAIRPYLLLAGLAPQQALRRFYALSAGCSRRAIGSATICPTA